MDVALHDELLALLAEAESLHASLTATGEIHEGYPPKLAALNERHARRLEAILGTRGWPGRSLVGPDGAHAAWMLAQHAISLPAFQRQALNHLQDAAARGEATPAQAAYLEDKIRFLEGRPQRYGTQFDWDENGEMSPWTLEAPDRVDELRRAVGLGPLPEMIERFRGEETGEHRPMDFRARQREIEAWARSVGWRRAPQHP